MIICTRAVHTQRTNQVPPKELGTRIMTSSLYSFKVGASQKRKRCEKCLHPPEVAAKLEASPCTIVPEELYMYV